VTFKILLISPPVFDFYFTPARKEPLGLLYIKSAFEGLSDFTVDIYNTTLSGKKKKVKMPDVFSYLNRYYYEDCSLFSLFSKYQRFGDSYNKIVARARSGYDLIAISSLFSGYHPDVEDLIKRIKSEIDIPVVVGGWAVTSEGKELFKDSAADFFIRGDGEDSFKKLAICLKDGDPVEKVPSLIYKKDGVIFENNCILESCSFLDKFPKREGEYYFKGERSARVTVSRGCLFSCNFCSIHKYQKFRKRSIESIREELVYLFDIGIRFVNFEDDNLFSEKLWSEEFLDLLLEFHKKGISFAAMNGITAINLAPVVDKAIESGFVEFNLSLVSSSKKTAGTIKRPIFLESIKKIAEKSKGKVDTLVFLIAGLPENTPEDLISDVQILSEMDVKIGVSPLYLLPGLSMFEQMGIPEDRRLLRGSALFKFGKQFSREDVVSIWKYVRMVNVLKGSAIDKLDESLFYFNKSVKEKVWYYKTKNGGWKKSFEFSTSLPQLV